MLWNQGKLSTAFALLAAGVLGFWCARANAHATVLLEEPYGFYGSLLPTGHSAIYLDRVCAETPLVLRRCEAGELGVVLTRYPGIGGYDWVAIPLVSFLYSVENVTEAPARVDRKTVWRMRNRYHESHLLALGKNIAAGNLIKGGWSFLVGHAYERRIYAFRFETAAEQDDALIARLNADKNRSRFDFLYNNCADFVRSVLNAYFPGAFRRSLFADLGITTPKAITHKLVQFARKHPAMQLAIFEIPQVPGYRRPSGSNLGLTEMLATTAYSLPLMLVSPYLAGGLLVDYLAQGSFDLIPARREVLTPDSLVALTAPVPVFRGPERRGPQNVSAELGGRWEKTAAARLATNLSGIKATHE